MRNYAQFESKVRNGGSGYAQNRELPTGTGGHKRRWYDLLLRHELEHEYYGEMFFDREPLDLGTCPWRCDTAERRTNSMSFDIGNLPDHFAKSDCLQSPVDQLINRKFRD